MASLSRKRSRDNKSQNSRKRQRGNPTDGLSDQPNAPEKAMRLDALPWAQVSLPVGFGDAEGFFGLEEISDVEVVKGFKGGKLECRLVASKSKGRIPKISSTGHSLSSARINGAQVTKSDDETEWEGFDTPGNGGVVQSDRKSPEAAPSSKKKTRKSEPAIRKNAEQFHKNDSSNSKDDALAGNSFKVLESAVNDEEVDVSAWQGLNLSSYTLSSIAALGFSNPTPIQESAIPEILGGHDVVGKAVTGSGKTLAFGIPILEYYHERREYHVQKSSPATKHRDPPLALILSPTRELAHQLCKHLTELCSSPSELCPSIATVTGGLSLHKQKRLLENADIIIGTPGRLWEVMQGDEELAHWIKMLKFLVIDEADRLLSEGHFQEVEEILNALDRTDVNFNLSADHEENGEKVNHRQTLVFSATFQKDLGQKLVGKGKPLGGLMNKEESMEYLFKKLNFRERKPKFIDVDPVMQMASRLKEGILECGGLEKDLYLYALLLHNPNTRTLIFTNSITSVRRLTPFLHNLHITTNALHSQMPQKARLRAIERFSSPSSPSSVLIASDVAARGLDIPSVQLIIHYHVPRAADMYVHRSGRTARAASSGSSVLLCAPEEVLGVRRLVAKVHARNASTDANDKKKYFMRTIEIDRQIVARLKPRVSLSKKLSDASLAKERKGHEDNWLRTAADDLGVDYDSEEFAAGESSKRGRGQGRKKAEEEARSLTKSQVGALRAELNQMLSQRVNIGVSERYLTAGGVDVDELLAEAKSSAFLGKVDKGIDMI